MTAQRLGLGIRRFFEGPWFPAIAFTLTISALLRGSYATALGHGIIYIVIRYMFAWLRRTERKLDERRAKLESMLSRSPTDVQ